jgi:hypothetical protein
MKYIKEYKNIDWDFDKEEERNIPVEFKGHEDFYDFLVDNDILDKWINNFEKDVSWRKDVIWRNKKEIHDFLNNNINYIDHAFNWSDTEEGYDFWIKIYNKWINEIY